jgi:hypothetical protein
MPKPKQPKQEKPMPKPDDVLRKLLTTPPQPKKAAKKKAKKTK